MRILEEARQPNTRVAEVLRRHQVHPATFHRWETQAKEGMREAPQGRRPRNGKGAEREIERLEAEFDKKREMIAEIVEENLEPKRRALKLGSKSRFTAREKREALRLVEVRRARKGWLIRRIRRQLRFPKSRYYDWKRREGEELLEDLVSGARVSPHAILPEEQEAAIAYALPHPKEGYRRLAWMMIDEDVAYVSPSCVYRILRDADLLYRWKRSQKSGEPPPEPNERWHTDLMYVRVEDTWYFLVTVLDAYSRYVVHWDLLTTMTASCAVRMVVQDALKKTRAILEIVTDNGSQFTVKDFKELVRAFAMEHIRTRTYHLESNGKLERLRPSTRDGLGEQELRNLGPPRQIIGRWVSYYNVERLHASLDYLPPAEYWEGDPEAWMKERGENLERGRKRRETINGARLQKAA